MDHAGRNETSILMAVAPDLVDLSLLPDDWGEWPQGVAGEDPRDATATFGEELIEGSLALIGEKLNELGISKSQQKGCGPRPTAALRS